MKKKLFFVLFVALAAYFLGNFMSGKMDYKDVSSVYDETDSFKDMNINNTNLYSESVNDYLQANINGTNYICDLISAKINRGDIEAKYAAYNPRGEKVHTITLRFDKNISTGNYSSEIRGTKISITCDFLTARSGMQNISLLGYQAPTMKGTEKVGSYDLNITYRSNDWKHYEGYFSAELGRSSLSGNYNWGGNGNNMSISNARFAFTLR